MSLPEQPEDRRSRMRWIAALEVGLAPLGFLLGWLLGVPLLAQLCPAEGYGQPILRGLLAAVPLVGLLALARRTTWEPVARFRRRVKRLLRTAFPKARLIELALVSIAAGVGEEILFRGVLQNWLVGLVGPLLGIGLASLVFGAVHPMSVAYVVMATFGGAYFGWLAHSSGEIVSAMVAHAAYDFVALVWLTYRVEDENA